MFLFILNKLKSLLLLILNIFRRAFCCFRRRRRQSKDEPLLNSIVVNNHHTNPSNDLEQWNDWEFKNRKPASVEEHIEYYRQQQAKLRQQQLLEEVAAKAEGGVDSEDLFQDMAPEIKKPPKVLLAPGNRVTAGGGAIRSLSVQDQNDSFMTNELEDWEDNSGWESEALEMDANKLLKQKKREERERRLLEQQQRRMEKHRPILGAKLVT